jgi:hypothetical protein
MTVVNMLTAHLDCLGTEAAREFGYNGQETLTAEVHSFIVSIGVSDPQVIHIDLGVPNFQLVTYADRNAQLTKVYPHQLNTQGCVDALAALAGADYTDNELFKSELAHKLEDAKYTVKKKDEKVPVPLFLKLYGHVLSRELRHASPTPCPHPGVGGGLAAQGGFCHQGPGSDVTRVVTFSAFHIADVEVPSIFTEQQRSARRVETKMRSKGYSGEDQYSAPLVVHAILNHLFYELTVEEKVCLSKAFINICYENPVFDFNKFFPKPEEGKRNAEAEDDRWMRQLWGVSHLLKEKLAGEPGPISDDRVLSAIDDLWKFASVILFPP